MKIILNSEQVIIASGAEVRQVENGIFVDGVIYAEQGLTIAETAQAFETQKNKFVGGAVVANPSYVTPQPSDSDLLQKLKSADQVFAEANPATADLEAYKKLRIEALKEACSNAIYAGFESTSTGAAFGFNTNDQMNFTQLSLRVIAANGSYNKPIQWKTLSGAILTLSVEQFNAVLDEAESHKIKEQTKFWQLEAQVMAATNTSSVAAISW